MDDLQIALRKWAATKIQTWRAPPIPWTDIISVGVEFNAGSGPSYSYIGPDEYDSMWEGASVTVVAHTAKGSHNLGGEEIVEDFQKLIAEITAIEITDADRALVR